MIDSIQFSTPDKGLSNCIQDIIFSSSDKKNHENVFQSAGDALMVFNQDMCLVMENEASQEMYGGRPHAAGTLCKDIFQSGEDHCKLIETCWMKRTLETGDTVRTIVSQTTREGIHLQVAITASPLFDDFNKAHNVIVILHDVTEEQDCFSALKLLQENEKNIRFHEALINSMGEGVLIIDKKYRIIETNKKFLKITCKQRDQVVGQKCYKVSHQSSSPCWEIENGEHECPTRKTFETGEKVSALHIHHDAKGRKHFIEISSFPLRNENNEIFQVIETHNDITEKKNLEERLLQAQKMESLGTLAGGIAHDLNNIMTPIIGNAALALTTRSEGEPLYDELTDILTSAKRATALIRHILAFSRRQILKKEFLCLNTIVNNLSRVLARTIRENINLEISLDDGLWNISADQTQIEQIIINLAVNARDAMADGGQLLIETKKVTNLESYCHTCGEPLEGAYVLLMVSDNGTGIDPEIIHQIFDPFFTTKEFGRGTGMGLSTVLGIMHQHQGHVNVYSEPGHGSSFKIYFPRIRHEKDISTVEERINDKKKLPHGKETVLVVDDEAGVRNMFERVLKRFGYSVITAGDGIEALDKIKEKITEIDLVIADIIMPKLGGKGLRENVNEIKPGLPFLFISGYSANAIHSDHVLEDDIHYIQKPPTVEELLVKVRSMIDNK